MTLNTVVVEAERILSEMKPHVIGMPFHFPSFSPFYKPDGLAETELLVVQSYLEMLQEKTGACWKRGGCYTLNLPVMAQYFKHLTGQHIISDLIEGDLKLMMYGEGSHFFYGLNLKRGPLFVLDVTGSPDGAAKIQPYFGLIPNADAAKQRIYSSAKECSPGQEVARAFPRGF